MTRQMDRHGLGSTAVCMANHADGHAVKTFRFIITCKAHRS